MLNCILIEESESSSIITRKEKMEGKNEKVGGENCVYQAGRKRGECKLMTAAAVGGY